MGVSKVWLPLRLGEICNFPQRCSNNQAVSLSQEKGVITFWVWKHLLAQEARHPHVCMCLQRGWRSLLLTKTSHVTLSISGTSCIWRWTPGWMQKDLQGKKNTFSQPSRSIWMWEVAFKKSCISCSCWVAFGKKRIWVCLRRRQEPKDHFHANLNPNLSSP